jgi:hypothetical protein
MRGAISQPVAGDDPMIEDLLIWKFVAEHPHCKPPKEETALG